MYSTGNESYIVPRQSLPEMYLIQGTESIPQFTSELEQPGVMYNEGIPEYFVDQSYYYPVTTGFDCVTTGYEPTGDWEDHYGFYASDGQDIHYSAVTNENLPYLYYTPGYGYSQPQYNLYDSYSNGAVVGGDGFFAAPQQYHTLPTYTESVLLPAYVPVVIQSKGEANTRNARKADVSVSKQNKASTSKSSLAAAVEVASHRNSRVNMTGGRAVNTESGKHHYTNDGSKNMSSSQGAPWGVTSQSQENSLQFKRSSESSQLKSGLTSSNGSSEVNSSKSMHKKVLNNTVNLSLSSGAKKQQNELVIKAYTTRAGNPDSQGNITIFKDQYNSDDFKVDYVNAKFFVIKSYSEDDVHKSVKYSVWSSTPGGNKRLNSAYEDAQRIATEDCPIFLFFSVNASGQFCGVAEMTGPVDFNTDMDFWQQDKWSGSFSVKWHIIKDVPNHNFRHIILENNENKSVTNSRDTQEIPQKKGLEMLRIFRDFKPKTSLLDDFMYYEKRQKILYEERRPRIQHHETLPSDRDLKYLKHDGESNSSTDPHRGNAKGSSSSSSSRVSPDGNRNSVDVLEISSLTLDSKKPEYRSNVVTIGSMPVLFTGSPSFGS